MSIEVVDWSPRWAEQFDELAAVLRTALAGVASARVEHVGSTSVLGLAAKPVLDVDVIVAVRDVLRSRDDLREAYAAVKRALAADPGMDIDTYLAGKSAVLQQVLEASGRMTPEELDAIRRLNGG
ncbi:GrpB family protein [Nocardioides sp. zg-1230]|uniref:GrpB family protein n=1 Tax=Nocardioides sp. zg-1230 TaxID=2736601 RepID=UPI0015564C43|nr:GrpB family protein [Nocardioides sp. zg-1230]